MRWSKLQKDLYNLIDPNINFQVHCRAYRIRKSQSHTPKIARYWITLGKDIIWDWPGKLKGKNWVPDWRVKEISQYLRDYINAPIHKMVKPVFYPGDKEWDWEGLYAILRAADKRTGKRKLKEMRTNGNEKIKKLIEARLK